MSCRSGRAVSQGRSLPISFSSPTPKRHKGRLARTQHPSDLHNVLTKGTSVETSAVEPLPPAGRGGRTTSRTLQGLRQVADWQERGSTFSDAPALPLVQIRRRGNDSHSSGKATRTFCNLAFHFAALVRLFRSYWPDDRLSRSRHSYYKTFTQLAAASLGGLGVPSYSKSPRPRYISLAARPVLREDLSAFSLSL